MIKTPLLNTHIWLGQDTGSLELLVPSSVKLTVTPAARKVLGSSQRAPWEDAWARCGVLSPSLPELQLRALPLSAAGEDPKSAAPSGSMVAGQGEGLVPFVFSGLVRVCWIK